MKRRTKAQKIKDLSERQSARALRGWRTRHLREQVEPRLLTADEIYERVMRERKGTFYATFEREGLALTLYHSLNRSDQFDVVAVRPSCFDGAPDVVEHVANLSMPKVLKLFVA